MGLGVAGALLATPALAKIIDISKVCGGKATTRQVLGPMFPDDEDVMDPIRESPDLSLPIVEGSDNDLTFVKGRKGKAQGQVIYLRGQLQGQRPMGEKLESKCEILAGATLLLWQTNTYGRYNHNGDIDNQTYTHPRTKRPVDRKHDPHFQYWGRAITDEQGQYSFKTILPSFYPVYGGFRPAHLHLMISAPGYPQMVTQTYFKGANLQMDHEVNHSLLEKDFILRDPRLSREEQEQLILEYHEDPIGKITDGLVGTFDIRMIQ